MNPLEVLQNLKRSIKAYFILDVEFRKKTIIGKKVVMALLSYRSDIKKLSNDITSYILSNILDVPQENKTNISIEGEDDIVFYFRSKKEHKGLNINKLITAIQSKGKVSYFDIINNKL